MQVMYKDPEKQREADRARQKRRRDKIKSKGVTESGRDGQGVTKEGMTIVMKSRQTGMTNSTSASVKTAKPERTAQGNIRVSKPGDADYEGVAV